MQGSFCLHSPSISDPSTQLHRKTFTRCQPFCSPLSQRSQHNIHLIVSRAHKHSWHELGDEREGLAERRREKSVDEDSLAGGKKNEREGWMNIGLASGLLCLISQMPANAEGLETATDFSKGSFSIESYVVTLGLFLISLPGLWSQIKRAPKASIKRNTFEAEGPKKAGEDALDKRARQIFLYFKKYNYEVKETGETITFQGTYEASKGQAAALVFYVFCGLLSTGLVLSIALPFGGQNWYWLAALSPLAGYYYWQRGTRNEIFKVKMVTSDDEMTTDILVEGDKEEIERMRDELGLWEKGKVRVKGLLEK